LSGDCGEMRAIVVILLTLFSLLVGAPLDNIQTNVTEIEMVTKENMINIEEQNVYIGDNSSNSEEIDFVSEVGDPDTSSSSSPRSFLFFPAVPFTEAPLKTTTNNPAVESSTSSISSETTTSEKTTVEDYITISTFSSQYQSTVKNSLKLLHLIMLSACQLGADELPSFLETVLKTEFTAEATTEAMTESTIEITTPESTTTSKDTPDSLMDNIERADFENSLDYIETNMTVDSAVLEESLDLIETNVTFDSAVLEESLDFIENNTTLDSAMLENSLEYFGTNVTVDSGMLEDSLDYTETGSWIWSRLGGSHCP